MRRVTYLGSLDLLGVLLRRVPQLEHVLLSEIGIVVKTEFGVHTTYAGQPMQIRCEQAANLSSPCPR